MQKSERRKSQTSVDIREMAISIFDKVKEIKANNVEVSREIDAIELEIRERVERLKELIDKLDTKERDLVKVLVINGIHRTTEEVLIK